MAILGLTISCHQPCGSTACNGNKDFGSLQINAPKSALSLSSDEQPVFTDQWSEGPGYDFFKSCEELQSYVAQQLSLKKEMNKVIAQKTKEYYDRLPKNDCGFLGLACAFSGSNKTTTAATSAESTTQVSTAAKDNVSTNIQEKGVDEADYIKISADHIFVVRNNKLVVSERGSLNYLGTLELPKPNEKGSSYSYYNTVKTLLYTHENRLISVSYNDWATTMSTFALEVGKMPILQKTIEFKAAYKDSRLAAGRLLLFLHSHLEIEEKFPNFYSDTRGSDFSFNVKDDSPIPANPVKNIVNDQISGVACTDIHKPLVEDFDWRVMNIYSINLNNLEDRQVIGLLGAGDQYYMNTSALYLSKQNLDWFYIPYFLYDQVKKDLDLKSFEDQTRLLKIDFKGDDGGIRLAAVGAIQGKIKDQWAFQAYDAHNAISVVTTTGNLWDRSANNHLWVLKQESNLLQSVASLHDFGKGEEVRSVRYLNNMAYVVTFEKTDPLFAFDMSDPLQPKLLGQLEIPGFSTYLHPIAPNRLIGLGFDAIDQGNYSLYQGIQLSLFDITDPLQMTRLQNIVHGGRGSYSEATANHHAFFFDEESKLLAFPLAEKEKNDDAWGSYNSPLVFSGAVVYDVSADQLKEKMRLTHKDLIPQKCLDQMLKYTWWWEQEVQSLDINRVFKINNQLISLSRYGIKTHSLDQPAQNEKSFTFPLNADEACPQQQTY